MTRGTFTSRYTQPVRCLRGSQSSTALLILAGMAFGAAAFKVRAVSKIDTRTPEVQDVTMPYGYRDWKLISVAQEGGNLNDIRAILGNNAALKAYRDGAIPFPDGAIIARLAWAYTPSEENDKVFGRKQSFVAGPATNVQLIVKDSRKFASTGGWGFAQFNKGNNANVAIAKECFACHLPAKAHDYLFTHYAP